jgi:hypothetical protein
MPPMLSRDSGSTDCKHFSVLNHIHRGETRRVATSVDLHCVDFTKDRMLKELPGISRRT